MRFFVIMPIIHTTYYAHKEEAWNVITHLIGTALSVAALVLLIVFSSLDGNAWHIVSFTIFGSSLVVLYSASTIYHAVKKKSLRRKMNVFDHSAIYVLIAGTYTPYCLVTLNGAMGWVLFGITWGIAVIGIILKVFFTGRYNTISTISYLLMGWVAIIAAKPLIENLQSEALFYLLLGGVFYTIGAVIFAFDKIPYNHAIFHVFVLLGSVMHFISVFFYLI